MSSNKWCIMSRSNSELLSIRKDRNRGNFLKVMFKLSNRNANGSKLSIVNFWSTSLLQFCQRDNKPVECFTEGSMNQNYGKFLQALNKKTFEYISKGSGVINPKTVKIDAIMKVLVLNIWIRVICHIPGSHRDK